MTAWSTLTAVHVQNASVDPSSINPCGVFIGGDPDGSKLYHLDLSNALLYEYDLTTLYDISTMTLVQTKAMPSSIVRDTWFRPDGLKLFFIGTISIHVLTLSTAWDISTATTGNVLNVDFFNVRETIDCPPCPLLDTGLSGLYMQPDGLAVYYSGGGGSSQGSNDRIYKQTMSIPYDISTLSFQPLTGSFHVSENQPVGVFWKDDGSRMYVLGNDNTTITSDSVVWEYGASNFNMNSFTGGSEFQIDQEDSTPGPGIFFLNAPSPNAGSRFWVTGRSGDIIEEWAMPIEGVEKEFTVNAILTLEFIEIEVSSKVVNRFDTGDSLKIGARLVLFCDNIDTNAGWTVNNANGIIFVDDPAFPDRIHLERLTAGGGSIKRWTGKDTGKTYDGDIKFEFKFDLLDDAPVFNFSGNCAVLLADSNNHESDARASGRSSIGFTLTRVRDEGRHIFFGTLSDGTTSISTIEGGSQNQHTHEIYKQTSGGADIQKGPYYCTAELKDGIFRTSIYLDSARTQHMRGSPREADATGINPTNLQFLSVGNLLGGGTAREMTGDVDELCITQNEPLQIIPDKPFPAFGQFIEGWETYTLGEQDPTPWTSSNTLLGASATVDIDIHEVSDESPLDGTQEFKQHFKHTQNVGGNTTARAIISRAVGPAIANTDGSGIDLARFLTARQKTDIISGGFNGRKTGVTITFSSISGGPSIGQMQFGLFGQGGNMFGSNSIRLNENNPLGTYAGFERFDLKALLDSDSFLSNNQGVDWENHVKFVTIRIGSQTRSDGTGQSGEALLQNDYVSLWGTKLETFLVSALIQSKGDVKCENAGISFSEDFETDDGWTNNDTGRIRIAFGAQKTMRFLNLSSTTILGIRRAVKALDTPAQANNDFIWEFKHDHLEGSTSFASESKIELKETSNFALTGAQADETTIRYTTRVSGFGPEVIRIEVHDKNGTNSVVSTETIRIQDNTSAPTPLFTFYPRITKTGNIIKLEMFIDESRETLAFIGALGSGGLVSGVAVAQVDITGFDMSQDLGFIYAGNYSTGGPERRANEIFDDIFIANDCLRSEVNAILLPPPNQVQFEFKANAVLKATFEEEPKVNAIIVLREEEVFFSTTHLQDITAMFSQEAPTIQEHEFEVTGRVVIRQTQNGFDVHAYLLKTGDILCSGDSGVFFQEDFETDDGWTNNAGANLQIDTVTFPNQMRLFQLPTTTGLGARGAVKALDKPFSSDGNFIWEFKHEHLEGGSNFASEMKIELKENSNFTTTGANETTIRYRTDITFSTGPERLRLEVFDKDGINSVFSPEGAITFQDNFTYYPRITKKESTITLELFTDANRTTQESGSPLQVDTTGFDFSQDFGHIYVGNFSTGGISRRANEVFDDISTQSRCPAIDVNAILKSFDKEHEFRINALLGDIGQVKPVISKLLKAFDQEHEFIVNAFIGQVNIVEPEVNALLKAQGDNGSCVISQGTQRFCSQIDAFIQQQGVITPESEPTVNAILIVPIIGTEEEFEVSAVLGLTEFQSILDVESVIGSKTGSQT